MMGGEARGVVAAPRRLSRSSGGGGGGSGKTFGPRRDSRGSGSGDSSGGRRRRKRAGAGGVGAGGGADKFFHAARQALRVHRGATSGLTGDSDDDSATNASSAGSGLSATSIGILGIGASEPGTRAREREARNDLRRVAQGVRTVANRLVARVAQRRKEKEARSSRRRGSGRKRGLTLTPALSVASGSDTDNGDDVGELKGSSVRLGNRPSPRGWANSPDSHGSAHSGTHSRERPGGSEAGKSDEGLLSMVLLPGRRVSGGDSNASSATTDGGSEVQRRKLADREHDALAAALSLLNASPRAAGSRQDLARNRTGPAVTSTRTITLAGAGSGTAGQRHASSYGGMLAGLDDIQLVAESIVSGSTSSGDPSRSPRSRRSLQSNRGAGEASSSSSNFGGGSGGVSAVHSSPSQAGSSSTAAGTGSSGGEAPLRGSLVTGGNRSRTRGGHVSFRRGDPTRGSGSLGIGLSWEARRPLELMPPPPSSPGKTPPTPQRHANLLSRRMTGMTAASHGSRHPSTREMRARESAFSIDPTSAASPPSGGARAAARASPLESSGDNGSGAASKESLARPAEVLGGAEVPVPPTDRKGAESDLGLGGSAALARMQARRTTEQQPLHSPHAPRQPHTTPKTHRFRQAMWTKTNSFHVTGSGDRASGRGVRPRRPALSPRQAQSFREIRCKSRPTFHSSHVAALPRPATCVRTAWWRLGPDLTCVCCRTCVFSRSSEHVDADTPGWRQPVDSGSSSGTRRRLQPCAHVPRAPRPGVIPGSVGWQ